jgi:hypothetical protein
MHAQKWSTGRVTRLLVGLVVAVGSVALVCGGGFAAIARSDGQYFDLGAHGIYSSERYALTSEPTNWQTQMFGWAGRVRLRLAATSRQPIFVAVAAAERIDGYLSGSSYTTVGNHTRTDHAGAPPAIPSAKTIDWTARAVGPGVQTLRWNATEHRQIVLAMNADRSRPVRIRVVSSAVTLDRMPWWVPAGALALGVILLPIAAGTLQRTVRPRRAVR